MEVGNSTHTHTHPIVAVGQNQWRRFGVGAPPILVYFSGVWDVHWRYGILTHGHVMRILKIQQDSKKQKAQIDYINPGVHKIRSP